MGVARRIAAMRLACSLLFVGLLVFATRAAHATPCAASTDCPETGFCVDDVCCDGACEGTCEGCSAVAKGAGVDGVCELVAVGTLCVEGSCDGPDFGYVPADLCDAAGACIDSGPGVSCLQNNPCKLDLCNPDVGCESVTKLDETPCGGDLVCTGGTCGPSMATSTSSSSSSSGTGAGGEGGQGGAAVDPEPSDTMDEAGGCGCRLVATAPVAPAGGFAIALVGVALRARRRVRAA